MGVKARPAAVEAIRQRVNQVSGHPAMGQVLKCLGVMAAGAVLAGAAVGGVLLIGTGINILGLAPKRLKVGNMLPAMVLPVIWFWIAGRLGG